MRARICAIAAVLASFTFTGAVQAGPAEDVAEHLEMWEPKSIEFDGGTLTVVTQEAVMDETVYLAIMTAGICFAPLFGKPLTEVKEIEILNRDANQGYVYEDGLRRCDEFNNRPATDEMTKFDILGATHWF